MKTAKEILENMKRFRKKPIEIEAYQITKGLLESLLFDGAKYPRGLQMTSASFHKENRHITAWFGEVVTIHNQKTKVIEGDWIITEPDGVHHYPCKPDIFVNSYDEIEVESQLEDTKCDMCGEIFTGGIYPVVNESHVIQKGIIQCEFCYAESLGV